MAEQFLRWSTWIWMGVLVLVVAIGYLGFTLSDAVSFRMDDGWCPSSGPVFGVHCWGDYGLPYIRGGYEEVYVRGNIVAANTPLTNLVFEVLRLLPYQLGLALVLSAIGASVVGAMLLGARRLPRVLLPVAVFVGAVGTLGAISSLDRANWVGLFPLPLMVMIVASRYGLQGLAGVAAGVLIALKFWAVLLVIPFIVWRRLKSLSIAGATALALYAVPLVLLPGALPEKVNVMVSAVLDRDFGAGVAKYSISFAGLAGRAYCMLDESCDVHWVDQPWRTPVVITVSASLVAVAWATWMAHRHRRDFFLAFTPTVALAIIAVPEAAPYNAVVSVVIGATLLWQQSRRGGQRWVSRYKASYVALICALITTNTPIPVVLGGMSLGPLGYGRWASILIPLAWIAAMLITFVDAFGRRRRTECVRDSLTVQESGSQKRRRIGLAMVVAACLASVALVFSNWPSGYSTKSERLFGQESLRDATHVGAGTSTALALQPNNYRVQGPDIQLYFPRDESSGMSCPSARMDFSWNGVRVEVPDKNFTHTFDLVSIDNATLELSRSGQVMTWSSLGTTQSITLPFPLCLQTSGAQLAAAPTYSADLRFVSGDKTSSQEATFNWLRLILAGLMLGLLATGFWLLLPRTPTGSLSARSPYSNVRDLP